MKIKMAALTRIFQRATRAPRKHSAALTFEQFEVRSLLTASPFEISSVTPTASGFEAQLSSPLNAASLHLYGTAAGNSNAANLSLVGDTTGRVTGSIVIDSTGQSLTFVSSAGQLPADTYSLNISAGSAGLKDTAGDGLTGNGVSGGSYLNRFSVAAQPQAVVVGVESFSRGPGQPVNIPASVNTGLPLSVSDADGVTSVSLTLHYDPSLLTLSGAVPDATAPSGATASLDTTTPGLAVLRFNSPTPLSTNTARLVDLYASVPTTATYGAAQLLSISGLSVNAGALPAQSSAGVELVDKLGDVSGDRLYTGYDTTLTSRLAAGIDSGFGAYPLIDPRLIADISGDGLVTGYDQTLSMRKSAGINVPQLPDGDPQIAIGSASATAGETVMLPITINPPQPGANGLGSATIVLNFDPATLAYQSIALAPALAQWGETVNVDTVHGTMDIVLSQNLGQPVTGNSATVVATLTFLVKPTAAAGPSNVVPEASAAVNGNTVNASLQDSMGNSLPVSFAQGTVTVSAAPPSVAISVGETDSAGGNSATAAHGSVAPGNPVMYTLTVSNAGTTNVTGATVADSFPAGLTNVTYSAVATGGATGFSVLGTGNINDTSVNLPAGSQITYTVDVTVSPTANGLLSNTATVVPPAGTTNTGNGTATVTDALTPTADLAITKTDDVGGSSITPTTGSTAPGGVAHYTIVAKNNGPSAVSGASIVDLLPANIASDSYTAFAGGGATGFTATGTGNINDTSVTLPVGATITYTVTATSSPSATGSISNSATITAPSGVTDPTSANNTATDVDTLMPTADLSITKTDNVGGSSITPTVGTAAPGGTIHYTITVHNAGPSTASGATVVDNFPATLTSTSFTAVAAGGATGFTATGTGNINDTAVVLPAGSTVTYTVTSTISSAAMGTLSNTAIVTPPAGFTDPISANNTATDADTLVETADLSITKTDNAGGSSVNPSNGSVVAGTPFSYTIVVRNNGPSQATGAAVVDNLPASVASDTYTALGSNGATGFTATGTGNINDSAVNLPAGSSVTYTVTATLSNTATGTFTNTATVTPPAGVTDPNVANNTATDSDNVVAATLTVSDVTVTAGKTAAIPVTLSQPLSVPVTVQYVTANGTATSGNNYVSTMGTLTFAPGVTTQSISVPTNPSILSTPTTFSVTLSNPTGNVGITNPTATVTIVNGYSLVYTVPGATGSAQTLSFSWAAKLASYNNEIGFFVVKDVNATLPDGTAPGNGNYAKDALSNSTVILHSGQGPGTVNVANVTGGQLLEFYLVQNSTTANFLASNPTNASGKYLAFFMNPAANPDASNHTQIVADQLTGMTEINFEDLRGLGDRDFNDVVFAISPVGSPTSLPAALGIPAAAGQTATLTVTLGSGTRMANTAGDVGYYFVSDLQGDIMTAAGTIHPSDAGYVAAALSPTNSGVLFTPNTATRTTTATITVPASGARYIAFYVISSGTTANFLATNPNNLVGSQPNAFLTFAAANPSAINHFRWFAPERVATNTDQMHLHLMDQVFGSAANFDDLRLDMNWS